MMTDQQLLQRISLDIDVAAGKPVIKGSRLSVDFILNLLAHEASFEEILEECQGLCMQDIRACLLFVSKVVAGSVFAPWAVGPD